MPLHRGYAPGIISGGGSEPPAPELPAMAPYIIAQETSFTATSQTNHVIRIPFGSGRVIVIMGSDEAVTITPPAGWGVLTSQALGPSISVFENRNITSVEGNTITVTTSVARQTSAMAFRVIGDDPAVAAFASAVTRVTGTTTLNPPSLSPAPGADHYLWIAGGVSFSGIGMFTAWPTNYNLLGQSQQNTGAEGCTVVAAERELNAATQDPGAFTFSLNGNMLSVTIAVPPSGSYRQVERYGIFRFEVDNANSYTNPFDAVSEIELRATFTGPGGTFVQPGYYDGGTTWRCNFMPNAAGTWTYTYAWVGSGTKPAGDSGGFQCVDNGLLRGPLRRDPTDIWYFMDDRGDPMHWRGYGLHSLSTHLPNKNLMQDHAWIINFMRTRYVARRYNTCLIYSASRLPSSLQLNHSWYDGTDKQRFDLLTWQIFDQQLKWMSRRNIYSFPFAGVFYQGEHDSGWTFAQKKVVLRYWLARHAPVFATFGFSTIWEWTDVFTATQVNEIMQYLHDNDPYDKPLSVHDCLQSTFQTSNWAEFAMQQMWSRSLSEGNTKTGGQQQGSCNVLGGIGGWDGPIIGSENNWETASGAFNQPTNALEVVAGALGNILVGIMPVYGDVLPTPYGGPSPNGTAHDEMEAVYDFIHNYTNYRQWGATKNSLVAGPGTEICSGITNVEYVVCGSAGGTMTINLSGVTGTYNLYWFNPMTTEQTVTGTRTIAGGGTRNLVSPFGSSLSVALLTLQNFDGDFPP